MEIFFLGFEAEVVTNARFTFNSLISIITSLFWHAFLFLI